MNTSDPKGGGELGDGLGFEPAALSNAGSPWDVQALAGLANDFFRGGMQALESVDGAERLPVAAASTPASSLASGSLPTGTERAFSPLSAESAAPAAKTAPSAPVWSSSESRWLQPALPLGGASSGAGLYFLEHAEPTYQHVQGLETRAPGFDLGGPGVPSPSALPGARPGAPSFGAPGAPGASALPGTAPGVPSYGASPTPSFSNPAPVTYGYGERSIPNFDAGGRVFDAASLRRDFPILSQRVNGKPLVWLDNAATTQKPQSVIDRLAYFYAHENSNVHRGAHTLAARSTDAYEAAREKVRRFLNAPSLNEIVFARGTTEAINLVAQSWGRRHLRAGDEIVITWLEHHSNIVPWQLLCQQTGAKLRVAPVDDSGQVLLDEYERLFGPRTRLASFTHVSNALGSITPVREMVEIAHRYGARALVDGAQAVSHMRVDVQALECDWYVFSGHKVFGPTGIGALYGKSDVLEDMPPWQGGGNMIVDVTFEKSIFHPAPMRFEAGTGNIADAVGLGAALDYVERVGMGNIARYEHELLAYGTARLLEIPKLRLIGTAKEKAGVMSFVIDGLSSEQVGAALAKEGIAVRAGHHCAQPALRRFGLETTVRPSLALYNTCGDIDALITVLKQLQSSWLV
jgi:cysteine desulfurase/selenocysteine lyase